MEYRLQIGEQESLTIIAKSFYSKSCLAVNEGEIYHFSVDKKDKWIDLWIPSTANGFRNILLSKKNKRVPDAKCFKLCGTIERNEQGHFIIGMNKQWTASLAGKVFFFANDSKKLRWYKNNKGRITLHVKRLG